MWLDTGHELEAHVSPVTVLLPVPGHPELRTPVRLRLEPGKLAARREVGFCPVEAPQNWRGSDALRVQPGDAEQGQPFVREPEGKNGDV